MHVPAVRKAILYYEAKSAEGLESCNYTQIEPVTDYKSSFGASGYLEAWVDMNATRHFVGSFKIEIFPTERCDKVRVVLTNTSSFESFFYGLAPHWERSTFGPMGNMQQVYWWEEQLNRK
ncbi:hypothetical protein VQ643_15900 [Pseudomonas sp. F1_0610]|uniref:hypothetical protein n=1 Tax=Pseudomonas sp. F1_0610 TaxID=3114284 RepID=UPI0039C26EED